ncbi:hypothetical protein [Marinibactrum halimedae]|uniref:Uncharacterized protein n=1 Tax=Marinibactrum halimedae TaxID=1444977 RepID=A0AA37WNM6_9GAMM|nr:hypothetical protein [Marinibactrum halimedae]MCD9458038.1 hypothetical protein [Marinibactrum halimedae]GLS27665.1 hypothetical protein GCM10007877_33840 [Marinibactrum halimedae]
MTQSPVILTQTSYSLSSRFSSSWALPRSWLTLLFITTFITLNGCTTITIDEHKQADADITIESHQSVVILGRRHSSDYETEPDLISCIGNVMSNGNNGLNIIEEQTFTDSLYPWFEPRTAPMRVKDLNRFLKNEAVAQAIDAFNIRYIVWVDGNTETTNSSGSIGCSISVGGAGCFGFGTWDKESDYEATIWDYHHRENRGQISADAQGTSYMPAVVVPIPLIARVQNNACKGMGEQLRNFFNAKAAQAQQ